MISGVSANSRSASTSTEDQQQPQSFQPHKISPSKVAALHQQTAQSVQEQHSFQSQECPQATAQSQVVKNVVELFVQQYYSFITFHLHKLHQFYLDSSQVTVGDESCDMSTVSGLKALFQQVYAKQSASPPRVTVQNIDFQYLSGFNSILLFISGLHHYDGRCSDESVATVLKFTQTFVLAPQPNGYYVSNDILRFHNLSFGVGNDYESLPHESDAFRSSSSVEQQTEETVGKQDFIVTEAVAIDDNLAECSKSLSDSGICNSVEKLSGKVSKEAEAFVPTAPVASGLDEGKKQPSGTSKPPKTWASLAENGRERWNSSALSQSASVASIAASTTSNQSNYSSLNNYKISNSIYVTGFGDGITELSQLIQLFESNGVTGVVSGKVNPIKKCAFVKFETPEAFQLAMDAKIEFNGQILTIDERRQPFHNSNKHYYKQHSAPDVAQPSVDGPAGESGTGFKSDNHRASIGGAHANSHHGKKKFDRRKTVFGDFARTAAVAKRS